MTFPAFFFEFSPGSGPFDTPSWVDISTKVRSADWEWGREDDLERFDAATCILTLYNDTRLFDPEYTTGTYFGQLVPRVPFRIRTSTKDLFYGFVQGGWEQVYEPPENAWCVVVLTDLLDVIAREVLPVSAYEGEVLADDPSAYWRLDETTGTVMADSSGNGNNGFYENPTLGEDPLIVDTGGKSIFITHVGDNRGEFRGETLPTSAPCTLEAWVNFARDAAAIHQFVVVQKDSTIVSFVSLRTGTSAECPNGECAIKFNNIGGSYVIRGHTRVDDGHTHHVACTINGTALADIKLYVDGVEQTKTVVSGSSGGAWTGHRWWTVGNTTNTGAGDFGIGGNVDEVAVYPDDLSAARILAHYEAGATAFEGESSGERIDRVLDLVGVPSGMRSIATGDTFMGPANYQGSRVGDYLRAVVESEQGFFYVDHANGGKLTFKGRYSRFTDTRSTTSQYTFSDQTSASPAYRYERDSLKIEPNGMQTVINRVEVAWRGGTEIVSGSAPYGPQSREIRTEAPSPVAARSAGYWIIARYSEAQTRVRGMGVNPGGSSVVQTPALDLRVGDMVTVVRQPQALGAAITNLLIVEGVKHKLVNGLSWTASYTFSDANTTDVWIWGTSAWDTDTFWG